MEGREEAMTKGQLSAAIKKNPLSVGFVVLALLIGVIIYLRLDLVSDTARILEEKTAEGERLNANVTNSAQLPEQLAALTEARAQIEKRIIRNVDLAQNLQYFYRLEADTGVKILSLRQNPLGAVKTDAKSPLVGIGFAVSVQGSYLTVLEFLRRLEGGAHYCRVMAAGISPIGGNRNGPITISISLELLGQP